MATSGWKRASLGAVVWLGACGGGETVTPPGPEPVAAPTPAPARAPTTPGPALVLAQAWFSEIGGRPVPQPAKAVVLRLVDGAFVSELVLDPESNVFHKALPYDGGFLTLGAERAQLKHWTRGPMGFVATQLWERDWGGEFDRLRDAELGDVDGDGQDELVIATHDQGVVAVGEVNAGTWTFAEFDQTPDTFVHEIEIGDVDGDGKKEFYATPSGRNTAALVSQPGKVVRYDHDPATGAYVRSDVIAWQESHAKEILVANLGQGDRLFVVREGHTERRGDETVLLDPVRISRMERGADGAWTEHLVATIEDQQTRFLVPGDVDGDGTIELVAAGMKSGLWLLEPNADGTFATSLIDRNSSGFEHATLVTDLDGDGKVEIYVAADEQGKVRRYVWDGAAFARTEIADIGPRHFTWNLTAGTF
jgi:hypothetical protein